MDKKTKVFNTHYLEEGRNSRRFIMPVLLAFALIISATLSSGTDVILSVEKQTNQTSGEIGDRIKYTINITNSGKISDYINVVITDILPPGFEYEDGSIVSTPPIVDPSFNILYNTTNGNNYLIINRSVPNGLTIPLESSLIVNITAIITSNTSEGSNVNKVVVDGIAESDSSQYLETDEATVTVKKARLLIWKKELDTTATPGDTIQYKITVWNIGTGKAVDVKVIDVLPDVSPSEAWIYSGQPYDNGSCSVTRSGNTFTIGNDLDGGPAYTGDVCRFTYDVSVPYPQDTALYKNTATVVGNDTAFIPAALTNDTDYAQVLLTAGNAMLVVNKEIENYKEFEPGHVIEYVINVSNRGTKYLRNITITDFLPIGLNFSGQSVDSPGSYEGKSGNYTAGTTLTWYFSNISGQEHRYIYLNATVMSNAPDGTNLNKVEGNGIRMDGLVVAFKDHVAAIIKRPGVEIEKKSNISIGYVEPGNYVEFILKVKNPGSGILYDVSVTDTMDAGWVYQSESGDCVNSSDSGNVVTFDCSDIGRGETRTIRYIAYVNSNADEGINPNYANVTGSDATGTPYTANDTISLMVYKPKLEIVKSASIYDVEPGSRVIFTVIVENPTYATAVGVNVTDILPAGFEYVSGTSMLDGKVISASASQPYSENDPQQNITWIFGVIPPKTIEILTFETHVRCAVDNGTFTNDVITKGKNKDGSPIQNTTYINMTGWKGTATISKSVDEENPTYYQYLRYTVVIRNRLNVSDNVGANILPMVITDVLPKGLLYVNGSAMLGGAGEIPLEDIETVTYNTGSYTTGTTTVKWNFTENAILLKPGEFTVITYTAQVTPYIESQASNTVNMTYLDPAPLGIEYCTDCEFNTGDINTIYPAIGGLGAETTYTISLDAGWNLISIPLYPADASIDNVLESITGKYTKAFAYDNGWKYVKYDNGEKSGTLDKIEAGKGYWLYMLEAADLKIAGNEILNTEIDLSEGWSLIGWSSTDQTDISEALASIDGSYTKLFAYDAESGWSYSALNDGAWYGDLTQMEPGKGCWIYMGTADTLVVNN